VFVLSHMLSPLRPLRGRLPERLPGGRIYSRSVDGGYHVAVKGWITLRYHVVAGLVPATVRFWARNKIIEVAGTSQATTLAEIQARQPDRNPLLKL